MAKDKKLPVIDLHQALSAKPKMFPDKIHPNAAGAKLMAETIQAALNKKQKKHYANFFLTARWCSCL